MCGIAGIVHADSEQRPDAGAVRRMCAVLAHRGPDGDGFLIDGPAALGMRRLAIIDVAGGDQPLHNEDRTIGVVQNGEIYNYVELRRELEGLGHVFRTHSDTEVLAHGYEAWGDDLVQHLNGMWAFALWDAPRRRLLVSRDRLGIKPLHWHWDGRRLVLGSEIKALLAADVPAEPNWEVLDACVAFGFVPEPYSMYRGIHKLPAGHHLILEAGRAPRLQRWWEVPIVDEADARRDGERVVEEFGALLQDAVRLQMRSDVPFGAFLSGGLDSGSIVALMAGLQRDPVKTFTIGFEERGYDERDLARLVAQRYGTEHDERCVRPLELEAGVLAIGRAFDEPFGDSSALATGAVSEQARRRVAVVLTGDGGDEVLAGYTRYQGEKFSQTLGHLPGLVRQRLLPHSVDLAGALLGGSRRDALRRAGRVLEAANLRFEERAARKQSWSSPAARAALLQGEGRGVRPAHEFIEEALRGCPARDNFHRLNWLDFKMVLPGQMLTKVDRMSMAHSLEARVPFLDHRLVELMAPVSARVKMPGYNRKHVLRRAMAERLPPELLRARKRGFNVPMREWFRGGEPVELLHRHVAGGALDDVVRRPMLLQYIDDHRQQRADHGVLFWILLQVADWRRRLDLAGKPS
jgi:asparagine synthase (glutamine-hydrolysing)